MKYKMIGSDWIGSYVAGEQHRQNIDLKKKLLFSSQITHYALFWMKNCDAVQRTLKLKQNQSEEEENHQFGDRSPFVRTLHYNWK